jgi:hypothetical protein
MKEQAHQRYKNSQGIAVPGVTTILSILAKPALIYWSWNLGMQGIDYRKVSDKAKDIGSLAHYLIECDIKKMKPDTSEYSSIEIDKAENAYLAWLDWKKELGEIETVASEEQITCDTFGGTLDWVIKKVNDYILVDFKTSKAFYFEMPIQVSAYKYLWNYKHPDKKIKFEFLLRIGKEDAEFEPRKLGDLDKEFKLFMSLLDVYNLKKEIEGKVKI